MTPEDYLQPAEHKHALMPGEPADVGPAPESLETGKCVCGVSLCRDSKGLWQSFGWPDLARSWADLAAGRLLLSRDCNISDHDGFCYSHKHFHFFT